MKFTEMRTIGPRRSRAQLCYWPINANWQSGKLLKREYVQEKSTRSLNACIPLAKERTSIANLCIATDRARNSRRMFQQKILRQYLWRKFYKFFIITNRHSNVNIIIPRYETIMAHSTNQCPIRKEIPQAIFCTYFNKDIKQIHLCQACLL